MKENDFFPLAGVAKNSRPASIPKHVEDMLKENFASFFLVVQTDTNDSGESVHCIGGVSTDKANIIFTMMGAVNKAISNTLSQMGYDIEEVMKQ